MHTCFRTFACPPGSTPGHVIALNGTYAMTHLAPNHAASRYSVRCSAGLHSHIRDSGIFRIRKGDACRPLRQPLGHQGCRMSRRQSPKAPLILALALPHISLPHPSALESIGTLSKVLHGCHGSLPRPWLRLLKLPCTCLQYHARIRTGVGSLDHGLSLLYYCVILIDSC